MYGRISFQFQSRRICCLILGTYYAAWEKPTRPPLVKLVSLRSWFFQSFTSVLKVIQSQSWHFCYMKPDLCREFIIAFQNFSVALRLVTLIWPCRSSKMCSYSWKRTPHHFGVGLLTTMEHGGMAAWPTSNLDGYCIVRCWNVEPGGADMSDYKAKPYTSSNFVSPLSYPSWLNDSTCNLSSSDSPYQHDFYKLYRALQSNYWDIITASRLTSNSSANAIIILQTIHVSDPEHDETLLLGQSLSISMIKYKTIIKYCTPAPRRWTQTSLKRPKSPYLLAFAASFEMALWSVILLSNTGLRSAKRSFYISWGTYSRSLLPLGERQRTIILNSLALVAKGSLLMGLPLGK